METKICLLPSVASPQILAQFLLESGIKDTCIADAMVVLKELINLEEKEEAEKDEAEKSKLRDQCNTFALKLRDLYIKIGSNPHSSELDKKIIQVLMGRLKGDEKYQYRQVFEAADKATEFVEKM